MHSSDRSAAGVLNVMRRKRGVDESGHADTRLARSVAAGDADRAAGRAAARRDPPGIGSPHGTRLPSSRQLSEQLAVSRNTVVRAYDELVAEGYVDTRPASGMFVAERLPDSPLPLPAIVPTPTGGAIRRRCRFPHRRPRAPDLVGRNRSRLSFDFFPGQPNASLFPLKTWRRLLQQSLSHGGAAGLAHYGDPGGLVRAALRHRGSSGGDARRRRRSRLHRHRQRHPGGDQHRRAAVPRPGATGVIEDALLSGRGLRVRGRGRARLVGVAGRRGWPAAPSAARPTRRRCSI